MHRKRLATGLRPDPLGELIALPRALDGERREVRRKGQTGKKEDKGGRG